MKALVANVVLPASIMVALSVMIMVSSRAQQNGPINLLSIAPVDANAKSPTGPANIDEAVDRTLEIDGLANKLRNEQQTQETEAVPKNGELIADPTTVRPPVAASSTQEVTATIPVENPAGPNDVPVHTTNADEMKQMDTDSGTANPLTKNIYGSAKIGRRKISDVGLAAIGVGDTGNSQLDNLIWRGTSARSAVFLLQRAGMSSQSQAISRLAYEVVARQSVPPSGANNVAADLIEARLAFLANGGRSSDLALLVAQLPKANKWATWRRWLTEHYLMIRDDSAACDIVSREITQTMEPFWHKSNVICQAVRGNIGGARFAADILAANGVDDSTFFGLVDEVLNNKPAIELDVSNLTSAHIVLMDVANRVIPLEGLSVLPNQMAETVMKLKFLGPDARMVSTFDGLNRGLISHRQAGKLWRNAGFAKNDPQIALARLDDDVDPLSTALAWLAIDADKRPERLSMVARAVKTEIAAGNGALMLPLYSELVRNALVDEAVASTMRFDDLDVAPKLAFMLAINQPNDKTTLSAFGGNGDALQVAELLRGMSDGVIDPAVVSALKMWHLMPILDATGVSFTKVDWLDLVKQELLVKNSFISLPPVLLKAVVSAAENRHVAETVLLTNWLLQDIALDRINPGDLATVIKALNLIGQSHTAEAFSQEVVKAHLMQRLAATLIDGTNS